jgi:heptosyltransferase-3
MGKHRQTNAGDLQRYIGTAEPIRAFLSVDHQPCMTATSSANLTQSPQRLPSRMLRPEVAKVLIYRLGSLGDTVVALPVLHLISRTFPNAERVMLTNLRLGSKEPAAQQVLGDSALVHRYMNYRAGLRDLRSLIEVRKELRTWKPQVLVYLAAARRGVTVWRDALFFALCGIREMVGLPLTRRTSESASFSNGRSEHEAQRLARCIASLGDARLEDQTSWDLHLQPNEIAQAKDVLELWQGRRRFVAFTIGSNLQANDWGVPNWERALNKISSRHPGLGLAAIGSADDRQNAELAAASWVGPKINLCGKLSARLSAAVMREAVIYLGHDTGPMHLAAAMRVPCVGVFSARNPPGIWFPWGEGHKIVYHSVPCMGCKLEVCITNAKRCITSISPDEVFNAAVDVLERRL